MNINFRITFLHTAMDRDLLGKLCRAIPFVSLNGNSASLGPKFDGFCANNGTKTKSGTFGLNMPTFVFVVLFAQKPPKLGPNEPHIG